jgi:two-component sensor histidine kinase
LEILLRELQHRVKNNLQTIISFLSFKRRLAESTETREKLGSVMDRVHAIALAHDQLAIGDNAGQVDLGNYLRALCANIDPQRDSIAIEVDVASELLLSLDRAVPVGLIVNELVTNSLKYAFVDAGGMIRVCFWTDDDRGEGVLMLEDNGVGFDKPRAEGTGLKLVVAFAQQLGGREDREPIAKGTRTKITFPLPI